MVDYQLLTRARNFTRLFSMNFTFRVTVYSLVILLVHIQVILMQNSGTQFYNQFDANDTYKPADTKNNYFYDRTLYNYEPQKYDAFKTKEKSSYSAPYSAPYSASYSASSNYKPSNYNYAPVYKYTPYTPAVTKYKEQNPASSEPRTERSSPEIKASPKVEKQYRSNVYNPRQKIAKSYVPKLQVDKSSEVHETPARRQRQQDPGNNARSKLDTECISVKQQTSSVMVTQPKDDVFFRCLTLCQEAGNNDVILASTNSDGSVNCSCALLSTMAVNFEIVNRSTCNKMCGVDPELTCGSSIFPNVFSLYSIQNLQQFLSDSRSNANSRPPKKQSHVKEAVTSTIVILLLLLLGAFIFWWFRRRKSTKFSSYKNKGASITLNEKASNSHSGLNSDNKTASLTFNQLSSTRFSTRSDSNEKNKISTLDANSQDTKNAYLNYTANNSNVENNMSLDPNADSHKLDFATQDTSKTASRTELLERTISDAMLNGRFADLNEPLDDTPKGKSRQTPVDAIKSANSQAPKKKKSIGFFLNYDKETPETDRLAKVVIGDTTLSKPTKPLPSTIPRIKSKATELGGSPIFFSGSRPPRLKPSNGSPEQKKPSSKHSTSKRMIIKPPPAPNIAGRPHNDPPKTVDLDSYKKKLLSERKAFDAAFRRFDDSDENTSLKKPSNVSKSVTGTLAKNSSNNTAKGSQTQEFAGKRDESAMGIAQIIDDIDAGNPATNTKSDSKDTYQEDALKKNTTNRNSFLNSNKRNSKSDSKKTGKRDIFKRSSLRKSLAGFRESLANTHSKVLWRSNSSENDQFKNSSREGNQTLQETPKKNNDSIERKKETLDKKKVSYLSTRLKSIQLQPVERRSPQDTTSKSSSSTSIKPTKNRVSLHQSVVTSENTSNSEEVPSAVFPSAANQSGKEYNDILSIKSEDISSSENEEWNNAENNPQENASSSAHDQTIPQNIPEPELQKDDLEAASQPDKNTKLSGINFDIDAYLMDTSKNTVIPPERDDSKNEKSEKRQRRSQFSMRRLSSAFQKATESVSRRASSIKENTLKTHEGNQKVSGSNTKKTSDDISRYFEQSGSDHSAA